jgi:hypothetical protein
MVTTDVAQHRGVASLKKMVRRVALGSSRGPRRAALNRMTEVNRLDHMNPCLAHGCDTSVVESPLRYGHPRSGLSSHAQLTSSAAPVADGVECVQCGFVHVLKCVKVTLGRTYAAVSHPLLDGLKICPTCQQP